MGIPSYFSYIVKNHSNIIKKYNSFLQDNNVHNLYLDSNSIIYDCLRELVKEDILGNIKFEEELIKLVCLKISEYINIIKPSDIVFISFDGVAPVAKMEQQRNRRFKTVFEKEVLKNFKMYKEHFWDKTCITPGTSFMKKLNKGIKKYFHKKEKIFNVQKILISGSDDPGEGEHKLFDYIKNNKSFHYSRTTIVYGLDADLIMLAINHLHISKKIFLFRETPEFIKSIDKTLDPNESYILDIPLLSHYLSEEMNGYSNFNDSKNILHDYIFICFLLGNDFLPHFPALNIRTNGIHNILSAYKNTIGKTNSYITDGNNINWKNFKKFSQFIADNELDFIKKEYAIRNKKQKRILPTTNDDEIYRKYLLTPIYNRESELYINPFEKYWEKRYYQNLFDIEPTMDNIKDICVNYLEGLEWTIKYYTTGCPDWHWKYKYHYPPLFSDLIKFIPVFNCKMINDNNNQPVHPYTQLVYVLPKQSLGLLPKKVYNKVIQYLQNNYPDNIDFHWEYCTYIWESHVKLPNVFIDDITYYLEDLI